MISIGILTHNSPLTLKNTLMSYKHYGLLNYSDDIFCVIQPSEKSNDEINICDNFNIRYYLENTNSWMQGGISRVFKEAKNEYVLFTENDFRIHTKKNFKKILDSSIKWLKEGVVDLIRVRDLKNPGHPLQLPRPLYDDIINGSFNNLSQYITNIHYWTHYLKEPEKLLPSFISKFNNDPNLLIMSSKNCGYTNNCFITTKKFFYDNLHVYAIMDNPHFEPLVDTIWHTNDFKIGITDGFLTHVRVDGHNGCWCCHYNNGGNSENSNCQCCEGLYEDDLNFTIDENNNDISKYNSGVEKINRLKKIL
jgi:hypothetical protein